MKETFYDAGKIVDQIYKELSKEELRELDEILSKINFNEKWKKNL